MSLGPNTCAELIGLRGQTPNGTATNLSRPPFGV
jgi:hypothetical protein